MDANCDGIDGEVANAVFVAPTGSDVSNLLCSMQQPCRTINYALSVATTLGRRDVYLRAGTYTAGQVITASSATSGATLNYTLTGATPTSNDAVFPAGGIVAGNFTLKVIASKTGATTSSVATASYAITGSIASARVIGGDTHSLAIRPDGVSFAWGANASGQLGDGSTVDKSTPTTVKL